jgi:hypothetical protein
MHDPADFDKASFRRMVKGDLAIIIGKLHGKDATSTQAYRYPIADWTEARAKAHCEAAGGTFEAAKKAEMEAVSLLANLTGEINVADIPIAANVNLDQLKEGDTDPLEVVVEIDSGKSTRKWDYLPSTIQKIVKQINDTTPNGFLGHQKAENLETEFPDIATHWIGAIYKDGKAFVRGLIDPSMDKLKRLIRSQRIKQVSIFGVPTLAMNKGETQVVDYQLLSLDWSPKDRNGMATKVIATSEIDAILASLSSGGDKVTKEEILLAAKDLLATGEMKKDDFKALIGDLEDSVKVQDIAKKLNVDANKVAGEIDRLLLIEQSTLVEKHNQLVEKVLKEKIVDETIRGIVGEVLQSTVGDDDKKIASEIEVVLQKDAVKKAMSELHTDNSPPAAGNTTGKDRKFTQFEKAKIR